MDDMSTKRTGRRPEKRRKGRRSPAGTIMTAAGALAVCVLIVCMLFYGVGRIAGQKNPDKKDYITIENTKNNDTQSPREQETVVKEDSAISQERDSLKQETLHQKPDDKTGRTVSILGDSISTFRDYIPAGYYDFFPENGLVSDVNDTWWKRLLDEKDWTLYVNGSSSGSACVGDSTDASSPQCGCNELRTGGLYGPDGAAPDVIIVYMGTNDLLQSIPLGDNDGKKQVPEGVVSTFGDAYTLMLDKLQAKYPASKIYCCTITQIGDYGTSTPYVEFVNGEGLTAADYSARIAQIAGNKNLPVIDLYSCGITVDNLHNTSADGVHPTPDGMKYIAEAVGKVLD